MADESGGLVVRGKQPHKPTWQQDRNKAGGNRRRKPKPKLTAGNLLEVAAQEKGTEWEVNKLPGDKRMASLMGHLRPKMIALFAVWAQNGRNISGAARTVGYNPSYARDLFSKNPHIQAAVQLLDSIQPEDKEWLELLPEARITMRSLLHVGDPKVRYLAAKDIVDRVEGKPVARIDKVIRDERPSLSDGQMQLAVSLMAARKITFVEARDWILAHPVEADLWIQKNVPSEAILLSEARKALAAPQEVAVVDAPYDEDGMDVVQAPTSATTSTPQAREEKLPGGLPTLPDPDTRPRLAPRRDPKPLLAFVTEENPDATLEG